LLLLLLGMDSNRFRQRSDSLFPKRYKDEPFVTQIINKPVALKIKAIKDANRNKKALFCSICKLNFFSRLRSWNLVRVGSLSNKIAQMKNLMDFLHVLHSDDKIKTI
jgi:hypothetical protein